MLMIAEVITPTFGVLGVGGLVAFVMGSLIMFDTEVPGYTLPLTIIAGFTAATGLTVFFIVGMAIKARRQPIVTGVEAMLGAHGVAANSFAEFDGHFQGDVMAFGEMWQAHSEQPLEKDTPVRIEAINGLILDVSKEN
jgi:membrane-bound serine protease (ClpP class)